MSRWVAVAGLLAVGASSARAPAQTVPESGYAILAYDASAGRVAAVAVTTGFSVGSGVIAADPDVGAVVLLGGEGGLEARRVLAALGVGTEPGTALAGTSAGPRTPWTAGAALTPGCDDAVSVSDDARPWTGGFSGAAGSVCYVVLGALLPDERAVRGLEAAFRDGTADLLARLVEALDAAERRFREAPRSRSVALWVLSADPAGAPLGRPELRLQVENHARPVLALETLIVQGRAEAEAREANLLVDGGRYGEALAKAEEALALDPTTAAAWLAGGRAQMFADSAEAAESWFRRMLEINPYLLEALGDLETGEPAAGVIPFDPRLLERLALYRAAFFPDVTFPKLPE